MPRLSPRGSRPTSTRRALPRTPARRSCGPARLSRRTSAWRKCTARWCSRSRSRRLPPACRSRASARRRPTLRRPCSNAREHSFLTGRVDDVHPARCLCACSFRPARIACCGIPNQTRRPRSAWREGGLMAGAVARVGYYRWIICALLFFAATINYIDRQVIGILKPTLQDEFGWSEIDYGNIVLAFQLAYGIGFIFAGRVIDWLGTRAGFSIALVLWSLAAVGHAEALVVGAWFGPLFAFLGMGYSTSVVGFMVMRFLLGLGEAGNFPAAIKTVA